MAEDKTHDTLHPKAALGVFFWSLNTSSGGVTGCLGISLQQVPDCQYEKQLSDLFHVNRVSVLK